VRSVQLAELLPGAFKNPQSLILMQGTLRAVSWYPKPVPRIFLQEAVETIKGIGAIIDKMSEIATTVASAVAQQGAATAEIARNIQQAAAGTQNVSDNIVGVSNAANQSGETASDVLESSGGLAAESEALSNEVGRFLARIKAA
jgi:methyl-accepting chemotaxis protein